MTTLDEDLTAKLWIEKYKSLTEEDVSSLHLAYHSKIICINKKKLVSIQKNIKKNHLTWKTLMHASWALLLNRLATADSITYGTGTITSIRGMSFKIQLPILPIKSIINEKLTVQVFINKIKTQFNSKKPAHTEENLRYLLLFKSKNKVHNPFLSNTKQYPLILVIDEEDPAKLTFFYHAFSFSHDSIHFLFTHLELLLESLSEDLKQKVAYTNILTAHETKKLLAWGKPKESFSTSELTRCAHELFFEAATNFPNKLAINHNETSINYHELHKLVISLASLLKQSGIESGDRVCVDMDRTPTLLLAMLAIFSCGAIFVPINPKYPQERIEYILEDCQPKCILVNDVEKLPVRHRPLGIRIDSAWESLQKQELPSSALQALPVVHPGQIAYIIYTSGTTGNPKGVMIKHLSLSNLITWYKNLFHISSEDRASQFASQGFDPFLCETMPFFAVGASVHMVDDNIKLTPFLFFEWLVKEKISICDLPTAYGQMIFGLEWPKKNNLRIVKIGGENLSHFPEQVFNFDIWNIYGPTETTIEATYMKIYSANDSIGTLKYETPPIGKPITNSEVYVVDKYMQLVPIDVGGELLIGGENISTGYYNRDDLTKEKFIPNPFSKGNDKLYRTGDLVRWLPDGNLEFINRVDNQVKIRGYRIELGDVEHAISKHPDVNEVVVLVKEGLHEDKRLIAYIVPNLEKQRYPYQERCLISLNNNKYIEAITDDISKSGVALSGINEQVEIGQLAQVHLKLPGFTDAKLLSGHIMWQNNNRCGIEFDLSDADKKVVAKSIDYFLSKHNVMELLLSASVKRSLRKALRKKVPEFMVPNLFVTLMHFPLTFSGKIDVKGLPPPQNFEEFLQKEYIPPKSNTEKKLHDIWCNILRVNQISMSDNFFDLGGNSLTAAQLSVKIFQDFNMSIPSKIFFDLSYIPILAEYIDSNGKKYSTQTIIQTEIERDCKLHENILPTKKLSPTINKPQNILLTGAGGFLGIYLLRELLQATDAKIYCLIRQGEFESAPKRLISTIQKFKLQNDISLENRRIVVIPSDISFDNFGLPLEQYNNLVNKIDLIYHCGAQVNMMAAYNKLRGSNVQGTIEIIKFATTHVDKPIHYVSTLSSAYCKDAAGNLAEIFPNEKFDELVGGYPISKWVSERLLKEAHNRGLPVAIYRSGYISGQSNTGMTSLNDALLMLIKGCVQLGYAPQLDEKITILPVDFVSKIITGISLAHPAKTQIYHLDHPIGIMWTDLVAWLNDYGYQIKMVSVSKWKEMLASIPEDNALFPFLPYYLTLKEDQKQPNVNIDNTDTVLKELNLDYPAIDDKLLTIYFDYLCQVDFIPTPDKAKETQLT